MAFDRTPRTYKRSSARCRTHLNNCFSFSFLTLSGPRVDPRVRLNLIGIRTLSLARAYTRVIAAACLTANKLRDGKFVIGNQSAGSSEIIYDIIRDNTDTVTPNESLDRRNDEFISSLNSQMEVMRENDVSLEVTVLRIETRRSNILR